MKAPPIPPDARRFRIAILPPFFFIFFGAVVIGYGLQISIIILKKETQSLGHINANNAVCSILAILLYSLVMSLTLRLLYPVRLASNGVYGYSFGGTRNFLGWTDIVGAKKISLGNLRFLRLYDQAGNAMIWIPLFLSRRTEFQAEVRRVAPPAHPVLSHLG